MTKSPSPALAAKIENALSAEPYRERLERIAVTLAQGAMANPNVDAECNGDPDLVALNSVNTAQALIERIDEALLQRELV